MKKLCFLIFLIVILLPGYSFSQQKIGYIDSESILKQLPEAQDAQKKIDVIVNSWKDEISEMEKKFKQKFDQYDKKKLIMSDQSRANAERELQDMDRKIMDFRTAKFGQDGELTKKQVEIMKPVQDRMYQAIQEVAKEDGFDYIIDKSGQIFLMYTNEKFDLTNKVIEKIGKLKKAN
jgi:outer membrane protein